MSGPGDAELFATERSRLLGLAYRVLGGMADAEDVVQETWLRWAAANTADIERPSAWLTTVTTRLSLDRLKAAQRRRESYVGPWLPEPIVTHAVARAPGPEESAEVAESLTLAFLVVLEQLDPLSRVVFLLTEVFACPSDEVAATVGKTAGACRQIASRARRKVRDAGPHTASAAHRPVIDNLLVAVSTGDISATMALLSPDVVLVTDGGPQRHAARRPVVGPWRVGRFLINVAKRLPAGSSLEPVSVNGSPGYRLRRLSGEEDAAIAFDVTGGAVSAIWLVSNPEKLTGMSAPAALV